MDQNDNRICFAEYEADLRSGELFRDGQKIPLQEKPFRILALLLKRAPKVLTREEIFAKIWGDTHVEAGLSLNTAMRKLRMALGDSARKPELIGTTPEGYTLLVEPKSPARRRPRVQLSSVRLAVAPFQNLGGEAQEYFAEGLTEQMIALLGHRQKQVSVIAPFSTLQYGRSGKSVAEIGRELNADYVLAGSVRLSGRVLKVTAMLVQMVDQSVVWSDAYSRAPGDIFAIQDEITARIARSILTLLTTPEVRARNLSTTPATYRHYLKGCFFANKWTAEGFRKAIEYLQRSVSADPGFAPAHAALARLYMGMSAQGILKPEVINNMTVTSASEALRLCPELEDAHIALGWAQIFYEGDWRASERSFLRAIELNPSSITAYEGYAHLLTALARHEEAIENGERACALDPLSPFATNVAACNQYFARRYDKALALCLRNLETDAAFGISYSTLGWIYEAMGENKKSIEAHRMAVKHNPESPAMLADFARALAIAEEMAEARSALQQTLAARQAVWVPPYWIALAYTGLGEYATAIDWLAKAIEERDGWRVFFGVDPKLDALRGDPRFQPLLEQVGLPLRVEAARSSRTREVATAASRR